MNIRHFKFLRSKSTFGKILRLPFKLIPHHTVLPILTGTLRGKKFIKGSHNISINLGTYERKQSDLFINFCKNSKVFWDLGAHVGYYTLLYHAVNPEGKTYAFEPSDVNAQLFQRHMKLNNIQHYQLMEAAVSDKEGMLSFKRTRTTVAGKLSDDGDVKVSVVRLSKLVESKSIELPDLVKMDIEGAELQVLRDMQSYFAQHKPTLFVSTHGKDVHTGCVSLLREMGYKLKPIDKKDLDASREILAFT